MRKTQKKILGLLGLFLVGIMTFVAAIIPSPGTSAITTVTDTIQVKVVGTVPKADFTKPDGNLETTKKPQDISFDYENFNQVWVQKNFVGKDRTDEEPDFIVVDDANYNPGDASRSDYLLDGFGEYTYTIYGIGIEGTTATYDAVKISYLPVIATVEQNPDTGELEAKIEYAEGVHEVTISYTDGKNKLMRTVTTEEIDAAHGVIVFEDYSAKTDEYTMSFTGKGSDGKALYDPYKANYHWEGTRTPDTGGFFRELNISKEDYLITGLIVFFVIGIVAFGVVKKNNRKNSRKR